MWKAIPEVFSDIKIMGCAFHWTQCIWRKIQEIGLAPAYQHDDDTYKYCKKLMALPYLPEEHITPLFDNLREKASTQKLIDLVNYIDNTWIRGPMWKPKTWCVFYQPVRTNNDVEGWHGMLNRYANRAQLTFYLLAQLLMDQSKLVNLQVRLVSEGQLSRRQRKVYKQMQGQLFSIWDEYIEGKKSAKQLLKKCARLIGPSIS